MHKQVTSSTWSSEQMLVYMMEWNWGFFITLAHSILWSYWLKEFFGILIKIFLNIGSLLFLWLVLKTNQKQKNIVNYSQDIGGIRVIQKMMKRKNNIITISSGIFFFDWWNHAVWHQTIRRLFFYRQQEHALISAKKEGGVPNVCRLYTQKQAKHTSTKDN